MTLPIITPIIYPSAAEFWASGFPTLYNYAFNHRQLTNLPAEYRVDSKTARRVAEQLGLSTPLSLFSNIINRGHVGKYYTTHCQKAPLPPNSFFKIPERDIYVACPELTFLQAARQLSLVDLIRLGFDLCAQYYVNSSERFGQAGRTILSTSEQIVAYAESTNHMHGSAKAIHAAKYVLDSSNSPVETLMAIFFELPIRVGGQGFPNPEMNGGIKLGKLGRELMGVRELRGDLVWRNKRVAVEYNSKAVHNNDAAFYNDTNRATALRDCGWQYIGVTPNNIHTFQSIIIIGSHLIIDSMAVPDSILIPESRPRSC